MSFMKKYIYTMLCTLSLFGNSVYSQCFPKGTLTTAAFATGGESPYKKDVLWLTWGAQKASDLYGKHNQSLGNGSQSFASIDMGDGRYLCITATISNYKRLSGRNDITSYAPGNYGGDFLDKMYNIGGTGGANRLVNGIVVDDSSEASFTVTCKATIDGAPVRLSGMVLGDAESLASNENFDASGFGEWTVVDQRKNLNYKNYDVKKTNLNNGKQKIDFLRGNDKNTGAVAFLTFNENAYAVNDLAVTFDVRLKGGGKTAIAIGLLPPGLDNGDAPESYGVASHMLEAKVPTSDNIPVNKEGDWFPKTTDLNTSNYKVGGLNNGINNYLGTTAPDADFELYYSKDAKGDDNTGTAGPNEEDAWPEALRRFSHKLFYKKGDKIVAEIAYSAFRDGYISGWIDFNQNGVFDDNERVSVAAPANKKKVTMIWTVPESRVIRSTYVRLRFGYNESEVKVPTGIATGGEIEDHKIYILGPARTNSSLPNKSR